MSRLGQRQGWIKGVGVGLEWYLDLGCASIYQYSGGVGRISFRI